MEKIENKINVNLKKVAIYIRVANKESVKEDSSIVLQKKVIDDFFKKNFNKVYKEYYIDNGYSGKTFNRPEFKRMMENVKSKKIDIIITKDLSRLGRMSNIFDKINKLKSLYDVEFISIDDDIDTINNKTMFEIANYFNQYYREQIKHKLQLKKMGGKIK